jgi:hypothetical protein
MMMMMMCVPNDMMAFSSLCFLELQTNTFFNRGWVLFHILQLYLSGSLDP